MNKATKIAHRTSTKTQRGFILACEKAPRRFERTLERQMETDLVKKSAGVAKRPDDALSLATKRGLRPWQRRLGCAALSAEQVASKYAERRRSGKTAKGRGRTPRAVAEAAPLPSKGSKVKRK